MARERMRLLISVSGVALSVFLISLLLAMYRGWDEKVGGYVEDSNVDLWIASEGTIDFMAANSLLPLEGPEAAPVLTFLDASPDVEMWRPVIVRQMEAKKMGEESTVTIQLVGYDTTTTLGAPLSVRSGDPTPSEGEIVVDAVLDDQYGVAVGDRLRASGTDWTVVGTSSGGDFVFSQNAYVSHEQAQTALGMEGRTTFYAVALNPGSDPVAVVTQIEDVAPDLDVFTRAEFAGNTRDRIVGNLLPILLVVFSLAFIVGLSVTGLTMYTATIEKTHEFGVLKALGFRNGYLYRAVVEQSLVTTVLGFLAGFGLTLAVSPFARDLVSQFVLQVRWQDAAFLFAATTAMGAIAAVVPIRNLAKIDPTRVFRA